MHTSSALRSTHFQYRRIGTDARTHVGFSAFCADYHDQDRVAVVSPRLEDGILHTGYALLALTTAFFDAQRARGGDFFVYPQHFAIIGADRSGVATGAGHLELALDDAGIGSAWGWLDVWPNSNWFTAPGTPTAMLRKIFDLQINRLFWPQDFAAEDAHCAEPLPAYARRILERRLKSVYYYRSPAPTVEIKRRPAGRGNRPGEFQSPARGRTGHAASECPCGTRTVPAGGRSRLFARHGKLFR